jgi:hypothetical protein
MRWFALPSYGDGHIRINLEGREARGIVPLDMYGAACEEIERMLRELRNARTDEPVVETIRFPRVHGPCSPDGPDADVVVQWRPRPFDAVTHPLTGRIGPFPYQRTGQPTPNGFALYQRSDDVTPTPCPDAQSIGDLVCSVAAIAGFAFPDTSARPLPGLAVGSSAVELDDTAR